MAEDGFAVGSPVRNHAVGSDLARCRGGGGDAGQRERRFKLEGLRTPERKRPDVVLTRRGGQSRNGLRGVHRGATADRHDEIATRRTQGNGRAVDGFRLRVRLDAGELGDLHARGGKQALHLREITKTNHGTRSGDDKGMFAKPCGRGGKGRTFVRPEMKFGGKMQRE